MKLGMNVQWLWDVKEKFWFQNKFDWKVEIESVGFSRVK